MKYLSMGMSNSYKVALEEGPTWFESNKAVWTKRVEKKCLKCTKVPKCLKLKKERRQNQKEWSVGVTE